MIITCQFKVCFEKKKKEEEKSCKVVYNNISDFTENKLHCYNCVTLVLYSTSILLLQSYSETLISVLD